MAIFIHKIIRHKLIIPVALVSAISAGLYGCLQSQVGPGQPLSNAQEISLTAGNLNRQIQVPQKPQV
jgi:hypothetical protein